MTITDLPATGTCELVWDLPNETRTTAEIHEGPGQAPKVAFDALGRFVTSSARPGQASAATVFTNVHGNAPSFQGFVTAIRRLGFAVFAKPQVDGSDIDDDVVEHVAAAAGHLEHLIIGTHDRELIGRCLEAVPSGCRITVLGLEECSTWARCSRRVEFVDLEDVPGLFNTPLRRSVLRRLPPGGAYLAPLGALALPPAPQTAPPTPLASAQPVAPAA